MVILKTGSETLVNLDYLLQVVEQLKGNNHIVMKVLKNWVHCGHLEYPEELIAELQSLAREEMPIVAEDSSHLQPRPQA